MTKKDIKKGRLIALAIVVVLTVVFSFLKKSVYISEYIFSRGFSRGYHYVMGHITSLVPFSVYEMLIIAAVILGLIFVILYIRNIFKKRWTKLLNSTSMLFLVVMSVLLVYTLTASMYYYREPLSLDTYKGETVKEDIMDISGYFLNDYNALSEGFERDSEGHIISPYTDRELAEKMREEFIRLDSPYFNNFVPLAKPILFSSVMSLNRILGICYNPTSEPNYNRLVPDYDKPFTMAHEIAHSLGVMREGDANLIASYITLTSDDPFIRYSGYFNTFSSISSMVFYSFGLSSQEYTEFRNGFNQKIFDDYDFYNKFWEKYDTFVDKISSKINDIYLKLMGQSDGTDSYNNSYEYEIIDNGETNEQGETVYDIELSDVQRIYVWIYYENS